MKITETNVNFGRQAYVKEAESTGAVQDVSKTRLAETKKDVPEDKVSLSASAKDMKIASDAISAAPDIRQDKVQEVKTSVDNGTYQIKPEQIAEKIIGYNINELV